MIIDRKYAVIKYFVIGFILLIIIIASIFYFTGNEDSKTTGLLRKIIMFIFIVCWMMNSKHC